MTRTHQPLVNLSFVKYRNHHSNKLKYFQSQKASFKQVSEVLNGYSWRISKKLFYLFIYLFIELPLYNKAMYIKDYIVRPDYNRARPLQGRLPETKYIGIMENLIVKKKIRHLIVIKGYTAKNNNGQKICMAVMHGCDIGYKYYAKIVN